MRAKVAEVNVVRKRVRRGDLGVAIAYPSLYQAAVRSLSVQMLYFYLNSLEGVFAERFTLNNLAGEEPPALSIESGRTLKDFPLILFSVHYEPNYVNIVRLLTAGGVPPLARERKQVVVVGGPPVIANPEPLSEIADVLVVGEIESTVPYLVESTLESQGNKRALLDALPPEDGFYVPSREDERVHYSYADPLPSEFHPTAQVQLAEGERTTAIEISRGCYRGCRFCLEGYIFLPKRDRPLEDVLRIAERGSLLNESKRITLITLSLFDHERVDELLSRLIDGGFAISLPSLRLDALTDDRLELLARSGQRTLVLAPETASRVLALAIGKPLLRERLLEVVARARRAGFKSLKLYFMVGLPGEREEDVGGIASLVKEVAEVSGFRGVRELKVSISVFAPKPQTPMQWFGMEERERVRGKVGLLRRELGGVADIRPYKPDWAYVQCALSRGGRELTGLLLEWARLGGGLAGWRKAAARTGVSVKSLVGPLNSDVEYGWNKVVLPALGGLGVRAGYSLCVEILSAAGVKLPKP